MKKTKILCTIGPVSLSLKVLRRMYEAGMNGARINTVFGSFNQYKEIIENVRSFSEIPILLDINGPGVRVKTPKPMIVKEGDVILTGFNELLEFNYNIYDQIEVGDPIFIDDGKISLEVLKKTDRQLHLLVKNKGVIEDGKGANFPNKSLIVPTFSQKDQEVIKFAKEHEVEFIGLSFTRSREDILNLKTKISNQEINIIAKIENVQGVNNFKDILEVADGIMIARGDLSVEIKPEIVPLAQKQMIRLCNQQGKITITATEMLDSMINNPTPTRAEVSDVANAILDGTDVVMLSGETAIGKYPVDTVSMMARITKQTEEAVVNKIEAESFQNISSVISRSIWQISNAMPLSKVVTITKTGYTARMISRFKIKQPIIAVTANRFVKRQLNLMYGIYPIFFNYETEEDRILAVAQTLHSKNLLSEEDTVLFTAGFRTSQEHSSNIIEIHTVREMLEFIKKND